MLCLQGTNLPALMAAVEERLNDSTVDCEMLVPYDRGDVVAELHEAGEGLGVAGSVR